MEELIASYRRDGFVKVSGLLSREEALDYREKAISAANRLKDLSAGSPIFAQFVNVWTQDEGMRGLTLHPKVAEVAKALSGIALRLWHDQILIKEPGTSKATEFHQDQPYWPHAHSKDPISCWIVLGDVPVEAGCMTFIPGQQGRSELPAQNLASDKSLMEAAPDMRWLPRITVPLQAGDATFHHGRCPHMATPNFSGERRVAHVVIFMPVETTYTGVGHVVTDPLNLESGKSLSGDLFPLV